MTSLDMKKHMIYFCDWAATKLEGGDERTAQNLFEGLHTENPKKTRNIPNSVAASYALKADKRFRVSKRQSGGNLWKLA